MQITVFGASGKVGSLVVEEALRRGYRVVAFVHSHSLFSPSGQLVIKKGDIYNKQDVSAALKGSDAVVSCLGSWGTEGRDVLTTGLQNAIPAMREHNIVRIVTLTGTGAATPGKKVGTVHKFGLQLLAPFPAGKVFYDAEEHMRLLAASGLDWTTVLSPVMTNFGSVGYRLSLEASLPISTVSRQSVAAAMLDQLESKEYLRQAPIIHRW